MTRLRRLIATALVDSFGLSLGWTVFSLHVVRGHGLTGLGLCNAAMLVGVAMSAPVAARLSTRLDGRALLRVTWRLNSVQPSDSPNESTSAAAISRRSRVMSG